MLKDLEKQINENSGNLKQVEEHMQIIAGSQGIRCPEYLELMCKKSRYEGILLGLAEAYKLITGEAYQ